jgi:DUF971 family protein
VASSPEMDVTAITVVRDSHVEVTFADDKVCRFTLAELRLACPCATCRSQRDRGEVNWPRLGQPEGELAIVDAQLVGAYALGVTWQDGHATGIYPFESLRRWCNTGRSGDGFPADSGLPS